MNAVASIPVPELSPSDDSLYEVVNGQRVENPAIGVLECHLASLLARYLGLFGETHTLGRAEVEMLFLLNRELNLQRRPDVAFVSYDRWPKKRRVPKGNAWNVVPDLMVEVVSDSNTANEVLVKLREYFQAGCRLVWVIYPSEQQVYVYRSPTQNRILTRSDELDGGDVLPGFKLPLADLFEEQDEEPAPQNGPTTA